MPVLEKEQMGRKKAGQDSQPPQGTPEPTKKQLTTTKVDPEILRLANMIADYRRIKLFDYIDAVLREATERDWDAVINAEKKK
jgi:hypothetical protein